MLKITYKNLNNLWHTVVKVNNKVQKDLQFKRSDC